MKDSFKMTHQNERPICKLLDFDIMAVQAFLKIDRARFERHCECLGIVKDDVDMIIRGLV